MNAHTVMKTVRLVASFPRKRIHWLEIDETEKEKEAVQQNKDSHCLRCDCNPTNHTQSSSPSTTIGREIMRLCSCSRKSKKETERCD